MPDSGAKIITAALELLRTRGPAAVTIEAVAAHSGVARTTIYRRYSNRAEMLTGALLSVGTPEVPDQEFSGVERLRWVVGHAASMISDGIGFGGLAALLTDADPGFTEVFRSVLWRHRRHLASVLEDGRARGQISAVLDVETLLDGIVGVLVAEKARSGEIGADWEDRVVDMFAPVALAGANTARAE